MAFLGYMRLYCIALQFTTLYCEPVSCTNVHCEVLHHYNRSMLLFSNVWGLKEACIGKSIQISALHVDHKVLFYCVCSFYRILVKNSFVWSHVTLFRCNLLRCASLGTYVTDSLTHSLTRGSKLILIFSPYSRYYTLKLIDCRECE